MIVDDEHIAHDIIKGYGDVVPGMELVQNCYDALEAIAYLREHTVDLIFLDLNMPKLKGFDFLKSLSHPPQVIVTTAYSEHALEGYELNIVDYLLKPFSLERFIKAINKLSSKEEKNESNVHQVLASPQTMFFKSGKKHIQVVVDDILYVEAYGNYCRIVTPEDTVTIREKISDLLSRLPQDLFFQVHKSFIIAKNHIREIEGNSIKIKDHTVPVGKMYRLNLQKLLR